MSFWGSPVLGTGTRAARVQRRAQLLQEIGHTRDPWRAPMRTLQRGLPWLALAWPLGRRYPRALAGALLAGLAVAAGLWWVQRAAPAASNTLGEPGRAPVPR